MKANQSRRRNSFAIFLVINALVASVSAQDGKIPDDNAAQEPAIEMVPGQNLFGETIGNTVAKQVESGPSQNVKRVASLLEVSLETSTKLSVIETRYKDVMKQLSEKTTQLEQLPNRYQAALGKYAELDQRRSAMVRFVAASQPTSQISQEFQNLKTVLTGLESEVKLMEQQQRTLPVEVQNLKTELNEIIRSRTPIDREVFEMFTSWSELLSVLRCIPKNDAESITTMCQLKLDNYPDAHLIRMMRAFASLQIAQTELAKSELSKVIQVANSNNDNLSKAVLQRCQVGMAWACILQEDLDGAAVALGDARKLNGRDYETAVLIAHLTHLRGKATTAFSLYKNATSIAPKRPEAYRLAADMTMKSGVREPQTALQLAKTACKHDESNDFRNSITLARAQHACGDQSAYKEAIAKAYDQAGNENKAIVEAVEKELKN